MDDPFFLNVAGVNNLISADENKTRISDNLEEGVVGDLEDVLELPMDDKDLLELRDEWIGKSNGYTPKIEVRQKLNKTYYLGKQLQGGGNTQDKVVSSNLIFEAEETFIPQALSKNPEPVVWSDNTDEGKAESNDLKTMLQYHSDVLCLRKTLGVMVRHWSIYFTGVVKHGWDEKVGDISLDVRKPENFILDPDGYIDVYGNYVGDYLGERIKTTAAKLVEQYPKHEAYIKNKVDGKMGTSTAYVEWWTDEYCFSTFGEVVLDKHKNEFFNYDQEEKSDEEGNVTQSATPGINHFAVPKMPYTFLSVFSLQEQPHDITNLVEQNIPNQDRITERDIQITKNLRTGNNSIVLSKLHGWTSENAAEGALAIENGDPILAPGKITEGIQRLPANALPSGILEAQESDKVTLRSVFGTQGLTSQPQDEQTTARGMILNQSHDSSRIGGGVGDALEQVADNIFNWWAQLYCVFYDIPHYAAVMGSGRAVDYVTITNQKMTRRFVISVAPNSMQPKDEISVQNMAIERWNNKAIDPIGLMKEINDPDPMESAKRLVIWSTNPQLYLQMYFPEAAGQPDSANPELGGNAPPGEGSPPETLSAPPASAELSQVPINSQALPQ